MGHCKVQLLCLQMIKTLRCNLYKPLTRLRQDFYWHYSLLGVQPSMGMSLTPLLVSPGNTSLITCTWILVSESASGELYLRKQDMWAPGWFSQSSIWLLDSAHVLISWLLRWSPTSGSTLSRSLLGYSLPLPLPTCVRSLSQVNK